MLQDKIFHIFYPNGRKNIKFFKNTSKHKILLEDLGMKTLVYKIYIMLLHELMQTSKNQI